MYCRQLATPTQLLLYVAVLLLAAVLLYVAVLWFVAVLLYVLNFSTRDPGIAI